MSNHLPECPTEVVYDITSSPLVMTIYDDLHCICDRLRACEQRVRRDERKHQLSVWHDGYGEGYSAALDAAREAVEAACTDIIAAIDALREETK